ncbi:hypothetical protein SADO_10934 [Salinisphaera dokdonensis CL-ES53]|uniref:DUF1365 domain-containing protein n=1 Tax=Salinisphaera dokdonensis CL-ES53 TaxID=1304272 RepID=A0ABV2B1J1_9GAMM
MGSHGALYRCQVRHRRPGAPRYRFVYRSFYLLLDIDAIDDACAASPLISRNRFNVLSFNDADHGAHRADQNLREWLDGLLDEHGVDLAGGRVQLLTMPRVFGYGFHPISVFYCEHSDGTLRAIVVEVHNTFGEHHFYVLHEQGAAIPWRAAQDKAKAFHVSPFIDRSGAYRFHFAEPGERLGVGIRLFQTDGADQEKQLRIATTLTGERRALTTVNILKAVSRVPFMTMKVTAAIHWQALKLWLRGAVFQKKPDQNKPNVS